MNRITICRAKLSHSRLIWEWRNDSQTRAMSRKSDLISWEKHSQWFSNSLENSGRYIYFSENNGLPFGIARFDLIDLEISSFEISIIVAPVFRGENLAHLLLHESLVKFNCDLPGDKLIIADIKVDNLRSNLLFSKYGFKLIQQDKNLNQYSYTLTANNTYSL